MLRATGYRRPLLPWNRQRQLGPGGAIFAQRQIRLAAGIVLAALVLGNGALIYWLTRDDAGVIPLETSPGNGAEPRAEATDLGSALEAVEAEISAEVDRLTVRYGEASDRRSRSQETPARGRPPGDKTSSVSLPTTSSGASGSSTGSSSGGSETRTGSGGSSGGSSDGGDTIGHSSSGSTDGSSGSSGGDTGGTGGDTDTTGGAGGGGGGGDGGNTGGTGTGTGNGSGGDGAVGGGGGGGG